MLPTIQIGDHIFVNKLAYSVRLPLIGTQVWKVGDLKRNDIVVFVSPVDRSTDLIKRVIAVPATQSRSRTRRSTSTASRFPTATRTSRTR
jgi:signal peptidase I